jgi:hypothetical protein
MKRCGLAGCDIAVTTGGVLLRPCTVRGSKETKRIFLQISSDSPPAVTATVAAMGVSTHTMSQHTSEFLVANSTSEEDSTFLGPKCCNLFFFNIKQESIPLSVSKNICDCVRSRDKSVGIPLEPTFFLRFNKYRFT